MAGGAEEALAESVRRLSVATRLEQIHEEIRRAPRRLGAMGGTLILRDRDECFYADEDAIAPLWKGQRFPIRSCISGWAMLEDETAVVADISLDARVPTEAYRPTFVRSLVMVPIGHPPAAAMGAYWTSVREPLPEEVKALEYLAEVAGEAIARVTGGEETSTIQLARAVLERALRVSLSLAAADATADGQGVMEHVAAARDEIDALIADARRFVLEGARDDAFLETPSPASPFLLRESTGATAYRLPHEPLPGVEVRSAFVPARGTPVGGDMGELVAVDDDHLLLAVGDVAGHGAEVAIIGWSLRELVHACAAQGCSPTSILTRCSKWLSLERDGVFATLLCALLDLRGQELQVASAGHPSVLVVDGHENDFVAVRPGPPAGIWPGRPYAAHTVSLAPGATILAFTDGLVERPGESIEEGFARLRAVAVEHRGAELDAFVERVLERLVPEPGRDDALLLTLRLQA